MEPPATAVYPAGARMAVRVLDDWELVWILRGCATLTGRPSTELRAGHLLLLPPGHPHGFEWNTRGTTEHGYVHFDPESVPDLERTVAGTSTVQGTADLTLPVCVRMTPDDPLSGLCAYLRWLGSAPLDAWQWPVAETIGQILRQMLCLPRPDAVPLKSSRVRSCWRCSICGRPGRRRLCRGCRSSSWPRWRQCLRYTSIVCSGQPSK